MRWFEGWATPFERIVSGDGMKISKYLLVLSFVLLLLTYVAMELNIVSDDGGGAAITLFIILGVLGIFGWLVGILRKET